MLTATEKKFIKEQLTLYQCTEREVDIYIQALQLGEFTIYEMADTLGHNRITVHSACSQLLNKGLL